MKNSWMKKALVSVILFAIAITSVPYGLIAEAAAKDTTEAVSVVLNGVVTDEDNRLPGGTYTLEADTTFSGNGDLWTFEKKTVIDLNGHTLTLDGVTLSIETGELSITDSVGNGQIYSENSQLFHITYKRSRTLSFENVLLVYGGTDTTMIPVWAECQIFLFDSSIQTTSEYAVYAGGDLWLWGATFSGFTNAEVILGIDGELCYFEGYETCQNPIQVSLKGVDLSEACSKSLIVPSENGNVPRSITDIVTFTELPENCQIRYLNGEYDAISLPLIELSGSYDLGDNMFPGISLDETGSYQMGNAYYKLTGNVSFSSEAVDGGEFLNIFLADGKEVILDLNGYTINIDTMTIRAESGNFTLIDTVGGGILNGGFYFDGRGGSFQMDSGTYNIIENPRVRPMRNIPFLLFGYSRFTITGGSINCYYTTAEMIEGMTPIIDINGGEINFYPKKNNSGHADMFQVGSYKRDAVSVTGGTIRMQGTGVMNMFNLLEGNLDISGGNFILKYEGSNESCFEKSALVNSEFSMNVNVSGGSFTTNTTHCFVNSSYKSDTPLMHFSGCPAFHVAKYDYSSKLHWGRKDSVLNSIEIKTDFNIGRKLNYYAEKTPTEETPIIFVRNWTENRGEEDPSDVMNIYLPEDKVCTPVVSDGNVTSGTIFDAPEPEPEYVDGLRVYELSGSYSLPNLEVPNTTAQDTADKYNWNDGYYRLVGDTTFTAELINSSNALSSVYINENVIIDLNGYTLTVDPIRFQTTADCNFTILDSGENGQLNGPAFMWGAGNFNLFGGTLNLTDNNRDYGQDWVFNLLGGNLYLDGAVVNCYHDSDSIMIQAMNSIIEIKSGEINCLPNVIHTFHQYLLFAMNSTVDVTGGTLRLESDGQGYLMDVYDSTVEISGGSFVATSKDTKETRVADTRVISGSLSNRSSIEITGGRFETNGDGCIEVPCGKKDTLTLGGNIEMVSANYDVYYGNTTVNPLNISSDFNLGRIMKVYTKKTIPSENNTMIFVKDWTKNKGEINPKDVFVICLPDGTTREPYVLEGKAVCGGVYENETVLNDTGEHIWNGSYDLATGEVASGMAISDSSLDVSVDRGTYKLESDVTLLDSSRDMGIISVTKTVEIDLQGHTLQGENIQLMVQEATGKLTIKDSVGGGKVTGHIEINASDSSELHIIGGSYDLNDPSGKRNCLYITGAAFSAKDATFTLYDNNNPRAGIYIGAGSSTLENCVVNYTGDDKSYAYTNSAVRVKGNATLTNCRITAKNDYGEVVALQKEGGIVKLVNCKLEASSNKIVPTFKYRACALENSAQYSSGRVEIDGGEYISNGPCAIFSKDQMIIHRAPQYVCSGNADIVLNSVENGYGAMEITAAYTPNTKTRVEFKSKDFSKLASASRSFVKNWNLYMSGKSPASVFKFMDSGFRLYVDGRDLYIGLKEVAPVATPTPAPSNTATIEQPVTVVVEPEDSSDERKEENTQEDIIQEEEEDLEEEEVIAPEVYTNISVNSADSKGVSKQKVTTSYDGTATVTKLTSSKKRVSLGATVEVDGVVYTVTSIGKNAFKNCKKVQTVTLPETITTIEKGAFAGAKKLRTIKLDIEKSITVEKNAFKGVNTSNMIIKVSKSMSKKELKKFKKELKKAGFEGSVERKL